MCLLSGGFGGARFAPGLVAALGVSAVSVVTNPGDDVRLLGGEVWPDFDAVLYALAWLYDEERGWGIRGEGFTAADEADEAGVAGAAGAWFRVGDHDLALCRERAAWLDAGVGRAEMARRLRKRLELGEQGVRVNVVAPGVVRTSLVAPMLDRPEVAAEFLERLPLGRLGTPGDVATCVAFLLSADAGYVTGQTLKADGGMSLRKHPRMLPR